MLYNMYLNIIYLSSIYIVRNKPSIHITIILYKYISTYIEYIRKILFQLFLTLYRNSYVPMKINVWSNDAHCVLIILLLLSRWRCESLICITITSATTNKFFDHLWIFAEKFHGSFSQNNFYRQCTSSWHFEFFVDKIIYY